MKIPGLDRLTAELYQTFKEELTRTLLVESRVGEAYEDIRCRAAAFSLDVYVK
jgi:hypothetical protein